MNEICLLLYTSCIIGICLLIFNCLNFKAIKFIFVVQYWDALKLCAEQHVQIDESLCEKLTPEGDGDQDSRNKILEGIAEVCMQQRQYHIATKKFTQAGNKVKVGDRVVRVEGCIGPSF